MNAIEIEEAVSVLATETFDGGEFPYAFLLAFGNKATTIKRLRAAGKSCTNQTERSVNIGMIPRRLRW